MSESESQPEPPRQSAFRQFAENVGFIAPSDGDDPYAHRRGEPRGFTVIWLAFLFLAAGVVYGSIGNPVIASAEGYRFASKVLLTTVAAGMLTIWPVLRLAQLAPLAGGTSATARDLAIVLIPLQALIWPQTLITGWSFSAVAVVGVLFASWAFLIGAVIAITTGPALTSSRSREALRPSPHPIRPGGRVLAMAVILVLGLAAPVLHAFAEPQGSESELDGSAFLLLCSPLTAPWEAFADRVWTGSRAPALEAHWKPAILTAVLAVGVWGALLAGRGFRRVDDRPTSA